MLGGGGSVTIGQYGMFVWATVVGIGVFCVWSTVGESRSVIWLFTRCRVTYIRHIVIQSINQCVKSQITGSLTSLHGRASHVVISCFGLYALVLVV